MKPNSTFSALSDSVLGLGSSRLPKSRRLRWSIGGRSCANSAWTRKLLQASHFTSLLLPYGWIFVNISCRYVSPSMTLSQIALPPALTTPAGSVTKVRRGILIAIMYPLSCDFLQRTLMLHFLCIASFPADTHCLSIVLYLISIHIGALLYLATNPLDRGHNVVTTLPAAPLGWPKSVQYTYTNYLIMVGIIMRLTSSKEAC